MIGKYWGRLRNQNPRRITQDQLRFLSKSVLLEESSNPEIIRKTLIAISFTVILLVVWSAFANVDEVARVNGEIIPQAHIQEVQHFDGGIIKEILTFEGDLVNEHQVLVVLDGAGTEEDRRRLQVEQIMLEIQAERLRAFVNRLNPDFSLIPSEFEDTIRDQVAIYKSMSHARDSEQKVIYEQIGQKREEIQILHEQQQTSQENLRLGQEAFLMQQELFDKGLISKIRFIEEQQALNDLQGTLRGTKNKIEAAEQVLDEYEARLTAADARSRDDAYRLLDKVEYEMLSNREHLEKLNQKYNRLEVTSPITGIVKNITINTIGGVIQPGQVLMEIVPYEDHLIVEVHIPPRDIGNIEIGQRVNVKVSAFDFRRHGAVKGHLIFISPTTFEAQAEKRYYKGRVRLERNYVGEIPGRNLIFPGMTVDAEIITGNKSILSYLMKPIRTVIDNAFKEK